MVVYIPNGIYDECKFKHETMEEFIKTVFSEWGEEYITDDGELERLIKSISIIDDKFGT